MVPKVYIVVLNWNQGEDTCECLMSLQQLDYANFQTIVVDNGSIDGSPDIIAQQYPGVTLIRNQRNLGYANGANVGIDAALEAGADYVFTLNNDAIVDRHMMTELVDVAESDSQIAIVGAQMFFYDEPEKLWFLGADLEWPFADISIWRENQKNPFPERQVLETDFVAGAAMLIRGAVVRSLGGFDPYFFIYWEDVELSVRFARAGYGLRAVTSAHMWHKVSRAATTEKARNFQLGRSQLYVCRKYNSSPVFWLKVVPVLFYRRFLQLVHSRFNGNTVAAFQGMLAHFRDYRGSKGFGGI